MKESTIWVLFITCAVLLFSLIIFTNARETELQIKTSVAIQEKCIEARGNWVRVPLRDGAVTGSYGCQFMEIKK